MQFAAGYSNFPLSSGKISYGGLKPHMTFTDASAVYIITKNNYLYITTLSDRHDATSFSLPRQIPYSALRDASSSSSAFIIALSSLPSTIFRQHRHLLSALSYKWISTHRYGTRRFCSNWTTNIHDLTSYLFVSTMYISHWFYVYGLTLFFITQTATAIIASWLRR